MAPMGATAFCEASTAAESVGMTEGDNVGDALGLAEGDTLGLVEGDLLGELVGACVAILPHWHTCPSNSAVQ